MKHLFKSLAEFQQEVPTIHKGTQGFGYSYADLPAIFDKINPLLKKHGLGFTQLVDHKEGVDYLVTVLFHVESGEKIESKTRLLDGVQLKGMNDFQVYGSQLTYFRRYALSSILGLVTDKDTDASGMQEVNQAENKKPKKKPELSQDRFQKALDKISKGELTVEEFKKQVTQFELTDTQKKSIQLL